MPAPWSFSPSPTIRKTTPAAAIAAGRPIRTSRSITAAAPRRIASVAPASSDAREAGADEREAEVAVGGRERGVAEEDGCGLACLARGGRDEAGGLLHLRRGGAGRHAERDAEVVGADEQRVDARQRRDLLGRVERAARLDLDHQHALLVGALAVAGVAPEAGRARPGIEPAGAAVAGGGARRAPRRGCPARAGRARRRRRGRAPSRSPRCRRSARARSPARAPPAAARASPRARRRRARGRARASRSPRPR